jgi:hypothetical protein
MKKDGKKSSTREEGCESNKKYNRQHHELVVGTSDYLVCNTFGLEIIAAQTDLIFQINLSVNELEIVINKMPKIDILPPY